MKTLKSLLLTTALMITSLTTTAQEKQSDATWEETIEFLSNYSDMMMKFNNVQDVMDWEKFHKVNFVSEENTTFLRLEYFWGDGDSWSTNFDLKYIENVVWKEGDGNDGIWRNRKNYIRINFTRPQPSFFNNEKSDYEGLSIKLSDSEINKRYLKAFQHLAYLAKEKREAARKASGDKF